MIKSENTVCFNGYRASETGSPMELNDAVNRKYLNQNTLTFSKEGYDAGDRVIQR